MAVTRISDIIQPELFNAYVIDRAVDQSRFVQSGVITRRPELDQLVTAGGVSLTMPSWNDLDGQSWVMNDNDPIPISGINAKAEVATLQIRAKAWGAHELAGALAGDDPMAAITQLVATWWTRDDQRTLFSILKGVFASASMADLIQGDGTATISDGLVLDGKQRLGDMADQLVSIAMHSATYTYLQKQGLIIMVPGNVTDINSKTQAPLFPTYLGYNVIVDDGMQYSAGVYESYLFAAGVISHGQGVPVSITPVETDRDSLMSTDYLIHRRAQVLHPMGISWLGIGNTIDPTPSNSDLEIGTNWERVVDIKKIGIVKLRHKLA